MRPLALLALALLVAHPQAHAVVTRDDVPDSQYRVPAAEFPALVDLPGEGHGVLIARSWVVTAAHALQGYELDRVTINGKWRAVSAVVVHPGFVPIPHDPLVGDAAPLMAKFAVNHDIALIRLDEPVDDVEPVARYADADERDKIVAIYGKGATGNGVSGQDPQSPHRGALRRAYNRITRAQGQWLDYRFDCGAAALPAGGVMGDGDSGGPVLIEKDGAWQLAGLSDWKHWDGDLSGFRAGICGQVFSNARLLYYAVWIDRVIGAVGTQ